MACSGNFGGEVRAGNCVAANQGDLDLHPRRSHRQHFYDRVWRRRPRDADPFARPDRRRWDWHLRPGDERGKHESRLRASRPSIYVSAHPSNQVLHVSYVPLSSPPDHHAVGIELICDCPKRIRTFCPNGLHHRRQPHRELISIRRDRLSQRGAGRLMRTGLRQDSETVAYPAQRPRHSAERRHGSACIGFDWRDCVPG